MKLTFRSRLSFNEPKIPSLMVYARSAVMLRITGIAMLSTSDVSFRSAETETSIAPDGVLLGVKVFARSTWTAKTWHFATKYRPGDKRRQVASGVGVYAQRREEKGLYVKKRGYLRREGAIIYEKIREGALRVENRRGEKGQ